jgi:hypothetical protein
VAKLQSRIYLRINHYYGSWGEVALAEITDGDGSALLADYVGGSVPLDDHVAAHTITWDDMTAVPATRWRRRHYGRSIASSRHRVPGSCTA